MPIGIDGAGAKPENGKPATGLADCGVPAGLGKGHGKPPDQAGGAVRADSKSTSDRGFESIGNSMVLKRLTTILTPSCRPLADFRPGGVFDYTGNGKPRI